MQTKITNACQSFQERDVPISEILDCLSGNSGLTEEYLYSQIQNVSSDRKYRILTGSTNYGDAQFIHKCKHPKNATRLIATVENRAVIHVVRKGKAGSTAYFESGNYTINDDAYLLYLKDNCPYQVSLKWLMYELRPKFLEYSSGADNGTWNKTRFFQNVTVNIPLFTGQIEIVRKYGKIENLRQRLVDINDRITEARNKMLVTKYAIFQAKNVPISKVLNCLSGNSGLTEEVIYQKSQLESERYIVLSSSTREETRLGEIPICHINGKKLKVFEDKKGILVIRNGKAGTTFYLEKGKYTINDHAYILSLKDDCKYDVSLRWLMIQYSKTFLEYSSSADNGTWNKTGFFQNTRIDLPSFNEQIQVVETYKRLEELDKKLNHINSGISKLFTKQIAIA